MWRDEDSKRQGYSAEFYLLVLKEQIATAYSPGMIFQQWMIENHPELNGMATLDEAYRALYIAMREA
jgi:hypothetical protein